MTFACSLPAFVLALGKFSLEQQNPLFVKVLGLLSLVPHSPEWTLRTSGTGPPHTVDAQRLGPLSSPESPVSQPQRPCAFPVSQPGHSGITDRPISNYFQKRQPLENP